MLSNTLIETKTSIYAVPYIIERIKRAGKPALADIEKIICELYGITHDQLIGKSRKPPLPDARRIFCLFATRHYSLTDTGIFLNHDHATVLFHRNKAFDLLQQKSEWELKLIANKVSMYLYGKIDIPTASKEGNIKSLNK